MADYASPSFIVPNDGGPAINIQIPQTKAVLTDQGYTYNQAGITYNNVGVTYGGVTNGDQDVVPTISFADPTIPRSMSFYDIGKTGGTITPPPPTGKNGPGFLMYVNLT